MNNTKIWAHRGASGYMPENTMEAFELAIRQNADGIELDVQMSKDGELMILHDETVDRVTDQKGFLKDFTKEQLKSMRVAPDRDGAGICRIPTLFEVLDLMRGTDMTVNIELKNSIFLYQNLEERVFALVKELGMEERVIYSTFNHYSVRKMREMEPEARIGLLLCDGIVDAPAYARRLGADAIHPSVYHLWYPGFVEQVRQEGLELHVWTANTSQEFALLKGAGTDAVITNYPDQARAFWA
ncbi:MAG: glycerophosphodiester phosphodiesterase [Eubacteriales bacterium]|nr:glycerophosphodiester phosphodiesterase [Eubacteriales bacterium]